MDVLRYLERLSYQGPLNSDLATLQDLHLAHLRRVPFENLDIHLGRPISLNIEHLFAKVVIARRGGFCYELNVLFGWLLRQLGFTVTHLSANVVRPDKSYGPEFGHLVLQVHPPGSIPAKVVHDDGWLADVGFGDSFLEPIPLVPGQVREQSDRSYKLDNQEGDFHLRRLDEHGQWQAQYRFTLKERYLRDFEPMSTYHQRSPESSFTQRCIVTIATDVGRITLADFRLITSREGTKEERSIVDTRDYASVLTRHFGIELPDADLELIKDIVGKF